MGGGPQSTQYQTQSEVFNTNNNSAVQENTAGRNLTKTQNSILKQTGGKGGIQGSRYTKNKVKLRHVKGTGAGNNQASQRLAGV